MTKSKQESPRCGDSFSDGRAACNLIVGHGGEHSLLVEVQQESFQGGSERTQGPRCPIHPNIEMALYIYDRSGGPPGNNWSCPECSKQRADDPLGLRKGEWPGGDEPFPNEVERASGESFQGMLTKWRKSHEEPYQPAYDDCAKDAQLLFTRLVELRDEHARRAKMDCIDYHAVEVHKFVCADLTELLEGKGK